jgi:hypothetical protein
MSEVEHRILAPVERPKRVVFVLPVSPVQEYKRDGSLAQVRKHDLANRYAALCVEPLFPILPWYADHPTDPAIRQESQVLTLAAKLAADPATRGLPQHLIGFSKSGVGAMSLLLRHTRVFRNVAVFDAPFMHPAPDRHGMDTVYGMQANYDRHSFANLLPSRAPELTSRPPRFALLSGARYANDMAAACALCEAHRVPILYESVEPEWAHTWDSGWLPRAFALIEQLEQMSPATNPN